MSNINRLFNFATFYVNIDREQLSLFSFLNKCVWMFIGLTVTVIGLVLLYLGMHGIMNSGDFVASGGSYQIAHHAPEWFWVIPVSIFGSMFGILIYFFNGRKIGGVKLLLFLWSALFLSLGYNFMEYAIWKGDHSKIIIGWLIPGIFLILMGGIPLLVIIFSIFLYFSNKKQTDRETFVNYYPSSEDQNRDILLNDKVAEFIVVFLNIAGVVSGIYFGIQLFNTAAK